MNLNKNCKNFNSSTNILKVIFTGVTFLAKPTQAHVLLIELMLKKVVMRRLKKNKQYWGKRIGEIFLTDCPPSTHQANAEINNSLKKVCQRATYIPLIHTHWNQEEEEVTCPFSSSM